jgi:hypothetical protein
MLANDDSGIVLVGWDVLHDGGLMSGQFVDVLCSFESLLTSVVGSLR